MAATLEIRLTHPERVLYAGQHVTKRDLAGYLEAAADILLPHVSNRLLSLVRCPEGSGKECFFQKHASPGLPRQIRGMDVAERTGGRKTYLYIRDAAGLVATAQMGGLELHIWGSRKDAVEKPDRVVFDLDPGAMVSFDKVKRAAYAMRDALEGLGLRSFPLLTGGKGIHVIAPVLRRHPWRFVKDFSRALAERFESNDPAIYVATMSKLKRKGRIFIDYLRNDRGATAIAPLSARANEDASVAWPVSWDDLRRFKAANAVLLKDAVNRLDEAAEAWHDYFDIRQSLKRSALAAVGV